MNFFHIIVMYCLLFILSVSCQSQDQEQTDESGGVGQQDPNLVNPTNRQGYGRHVQTQVSNTKPMPTSKPASSTSDVKSIGEQTVQAALQLGVLVAVALLCGILFMVFIGIEMLYDAIVEKLSEMIGKKVYVTDDPAALVGTFKRYK